MSFDPFGQLQPLPPSSTTPSDGPAPGPVAPTPSDAARERVLLPGIFLIVLGAINALFLLYPIGTTALAYLTPDDVLEEQARAGVDFWKKALPDAAAKLEEQKQNLTASAIRSQHLQIGIVGGIVLAGGAFVIILGGIRMVQLRSYGLAMFAAVFVCVPCVSLPGCLCFAGQAVGLWALIVLMSDDVRNAFR